MRNYLILAVIATLVLSGTTRDIPMGGMDHLPEKDQKMGGMDIVNPNDEILMGGMNIINPVYQPEDDEMLMGGMNIINPVYLPEDDEMLMGGMNMINPALLPKDDEMLMGGMNMINPALLPKDQIMGGMDIVNPAEQQRMGGMDIVNPDEEMLMGGMNMINPALLPKDNGNKRLLDVNACLSDKFQFDETLKGNKCETHCDCDGLRTCSEWKWCQGTSRKEEVHKETKESKLIGGLHDNWKSAWAKKINEVIGGDKIETDKPVKETKQMRHWKKARGIKKIIKIGGGNHDNWMAAQAKKV
jgi:hypothetical protein